MKQIICIKPNEDVAYKGLKHINEHNVPVGDVAEKKILEYYQDL